MCTVTIIPKGETDFVLTSNRDEAPNRISLMPEIYSINSVRMMMPKDKMSGGTWIGVSDMKRMVCLLNGGFKFHERLASYRMSRGVVVTDILASKNILDTIETYNLKNVEPFTIVIVEWITNLKFMELVWDGNQKHFKDLPLEPKIWSSSTLYSDTMKNERLNWFEEFKSKTELNSLNTLQFHKTAGIGNDDYGVIMNRHFVKTTSITQVEKTSDVIKMSHENLQNNTSSTSIFVHTLIVNE